MDILFVGLDKINLDDDSNFIEEAPDTIIHVILLAWRSKFEKRKEIVVGLVHVRR